MGSLARASSGFFARGADSGPRWHRWPCHKCGYEERNPALLCPECDAPPWDEHATGGPAGPPAGSEIEVVSRGLIRNRFRFRTPTGFLGVLSRRLSGGGEWLGVDGAEWRIDRLGLLGFATILRGDAGPLAGAQAPSLMHGLFRGDFVVLHGTESWRFNRAGLARNNYALVADDDQEVLSMHGGFFDPLRRIEVARAAPLAVIVLAAYLACGSRHTEGEA